jgi:acylphosphatase
MAQGLADQYGISGYVRNLPSGDVELLAEGVAQDVELFLTALRERMSRYIEDCSVATVEPTGAKEFRIRH